MWECSLARPHRYPSGEHTRRNPRFTTVEKQEDSTIPEFSLCEWFESFNNASVRFA
jgi:hypothetical protein